jgi:uncharacterized membrane protein
MPREAHLWAIGFDDTSRAGEVRQEIISLAGPQQTLILLDTAVVIRQADGSITLEREPIHAIRNVISGGVVGFLAGLVIAAPLGGAAVGALVGLTGSAVASAIEIDDAFIQEVEAAMKPATSVLFVLDDQGDMDLLLVRIRGLGGTVMRTNVDLERAKLIQSTLSAQSVEPVDKKS